MVSGREGIRRIHRCYVDGESPRPRPLLYTSQDERVVIRSVPLAKAVLIIRNASARNCPFGDTFVNQQCQELEHTTLECDNSVAIGVRVQFSFLQEANYCCSEPNGWTILSANTSLQR